MHSEAGAGKRVTVLSLLVLLASMLTVPAAVAAASVIPNSSSPQFRGHPPMNSGYDEQIGLTFTQNFTTIAYNVTAVEQTDPTLGTGPGYLLSGLANSGYWYQVGLSWNWSPGVGFAMSYEVFNPSGQSIYPTNGGGGLAGFSGPVDQGDNVTITLYFSSGDVIMAAMDTNTGASAQQSYPAEGGTQFLGQPNGDANAIGFFTGLMTEWYHGEPYYADGAEVLYTTSSAISSGWMWMDEFNANNGQLVFASNATSVNIYSSGPSQLQEYSYQGITEYSSGTAFVTGALSGSTTTTSGTSTVTSTVTSTDTSTVVSAETQTVTSTSTVTQPVTTTVTTQPPTVTDTTTSTVPTTQTVTQNETSTTTQTATQTLTTTVASIPLWVYALMALILLGGVALGYLMRRPPPVETQTA